jgi:hypothetical protein
MTLSLSIDFFVEFEDQETFKYVRDHKKIAMKYFKSGWLIIDFMATFPFDKFLAGDNNDSTNIIMTKMLRLTRLSRIWAIFDLSRVNRLLKQLFESSQRQDRIVA